MSKYGVSYYYYATGMEGKEDRIEEQIIEADSESEAIYLFVEQNKSFWGGYVSKTYNEFIEQPEWERNWGITIRELC